MRLGQDLSDITAEDIKPFGSFERETWPADWYRMVIDNTDYLDTKAGTGKRLLLTMICLQGPYQSKLRWDSLNLANPNAETVRIARITLKQIAVAVGLENPDRVEDSDELVGKPMMVHLRVVTADEGYGDASGKQNEIGEYMSVADYEKKHGTPTQVTPNPAAGQMNPDAEPPF